ncbi:hypothetical protein TASCI_50089 [Tenacibaculum ascidiaceicola]
MHPQFQKYAGVVELVDTLDLGSSAVRCESSSLSARTELKMSVLDFSKTFFLCQILKEYTEKYTKVHEKVHRNV